MGQPADAVQVRAGERLERVRAEFAAGDTAQAARDYWAGCEEVKGEDGGNASGYWSDAAPLATADERSAWAELWKREPDGATVCGYFGRFWAERANRAGMTVTARLATHYARLGYAREHYSRVGGLRDRLGTSALPLSRRIGRPPEVALDDRGLIYVRMGPPDRRASFGGQVQNPVISPSCYAPNESWAYDFPSGARVYHFSPLGGVADWWLIDNLGDIYQCGDPDYVVGGKGRMRTVGVLNPTNGGPVPPIETIAYLVLPELYESRQGLDVRYTRVAYRLRTVVPPSGGFRLSDPGKIMDAREQLVTERKWTWADGYFALDSVPDRPAVRPVVELRYEALQFRGRDGRRTRVWLNGVARGKTLRPATLPDGQLLYRVQVNYSLLNEAGAQSLATRSFQAESDHRLSGGEGIPYRVPVDLTPGSYDYTLLVRDANGSADVPAGNYRWGTLAVRPLRGDLPELSDVAVAPDSGGSWSPGARVHLRASPVHLTSPGGIAYLYYEAYGLTPGGETVTTVSLRPATGKGKSFELRYPGQAPVEAGEVAWGFLRLDLSRTQPGAYLAEVRVRDTNTGVETLPIKVHLSVEHP